MTDTVDPGTGEVLPAVFQPRHYIANLHAGIGVQQALSSAYDAAVRDLIGPNDVHKQDGREYKKKSAWRKLARHFNISTQVVGKPTIQWNGDQFLVAVTVQATAPWGQTVENVGACGSDEATGRREISMADAIATAQTRATNRAVSDLIGMGEVSADELNPRRQTEPRAVPASKTPASGAVIPFGKSKGTPLKDLTTEDIAGALTWAESKGKFEGFQRDARAELSSRESPKPAPSFADVPPAVAEAEDDLPF